MTLFSTFVPSLAIDPSNSSTLFAATSGAGVFESTDAGATWTQFGSGLTNMIVNVVAVGSSASGTLYAGTDGGVFQIQIGSTDSPDSAPGFASTATKSGEASH